MYITYLQIHTHTYIYIYMHIYVYWDVYIHMYIFMFIYTSMYWHISTFIHLFLQWLSHHNGCRWLPRPRARRLQSQAFLRKSGPVLSLALMWPHLQAPWGQHVENYRSKRMVSRTEPWTKTTMAPNMILTGFIFLCCADIICACHVHIRTIQKLHTANAIL